VVALVLVSLAGVTAAAEGCQTIGYYRNALTIEAPITDGISEVDQAAIRAATDRYTAALDEDKRIVFPIAASEVILGMAMFAFAAAAMSGRDGARRALTQIVAVRAGVLILSFFMTKRVRAAGDEVGHARDIALMRVADGDRAESIVGAVDRHRKSIALAGVTVKAIALGLVVLALTRRRTRDFYETAEAQLADE
jgi:hypothetical protein